MSVVSLALLVVYIFGHGPIAIGLGSFHRGIRLTRWPVGAHRDISQQHTCINSNIYIYTL